MLRVGLTGGIGSGKTSATEMFAKLGVAVIDADTISHQLTSPGSESVKQIKSQLGDQFITSQDELDRKQLAQYVFENPDKKKILENILHPKVRAAMSTELMNIGSTPYVILVIPLLFETNFTDLTDRILVIDTSEDTQIQRVIDRDDRSPEDIRAIINQQVDRKTRLEKADDIIDNNGTLEALQASISQLHNKYLKISSKKTGE